MKIIQRYKKTLAMSVAALGLLAGLTLESSMAYFTTYVSAGGSQTVNLEAQTKIYEDVEQMAKQIQIKNTSTKGDCFVRVKVFYGGGLDVRFVDVDKKGNWEERGDGYWYYKPVLPMGEKTSRFDVTIDTKNLEKPSTNPDEVVEYIKDKFNVIVVQECTPVRYDADGTPKADWNTIYTDFVEVEGGEEAGN